MRAFVSDLATIRVPWFTWTGFIVFRRTFACTDSVHMSRCA